MNATVRANDELRIAIGLTLGSWLFACGPGVVDLDESGTTSTTGGDDDGTSMDSSEDGVGDGTGDGLCQWEPPEDPFEVEVSPECAYLDSPDEVAPVTLRISNLGGDIVYLTSVVTCTAQHYYIEDAMGRGYPQACAWPCEASVLGDCGCLSNCPFPPTVALYPGGVFETEWRGWVYEVTSAERACVGDCAGECGLSVAPTEGQINVSVGLAEVLTCGEDCGCSPNADGWCEVPGLPDQEPAILSTTFMWPPTCPLLEIEV